MLIFESCRQARLVTVGGMGGKHASETLHRLICMRLHHVYLMYTVCDLPFTLYILCSLRCMAICARVRGVLKILT